MKLTKEQVAQIDEYFKNLGIGYWDIRLEMTDHVASRLESMEGHFDFDFALKTVLNDSGWTGNLKWLERQRLLAINRITRSAYFKNVVSFFTNSRSLLIILISIALYYLLYKVIPINYFKWLSFALFCGPVLFFTAHSAWTYFKIKKVGYLTYGYFYIAFSVLVTNGIPQLFRPDGLFEVSRLTSHRILLVMTVVNLLFIASGIKIYMKYYKQYKRLYLKLNR